MNKLKLLLMLLAFPILGNAQSKVLKDVYDNYAHLEESFTLNISGNFLKMADWFDDDWEDDDKENLAQSIDNIRILKVPSGQYGMDDDEVERFKRDILREKYDEFMNVRGDDGGKFYVMAKERKGIISDLVIYGKGDEGVLFIEFTGAMNSKKVSKLCRDIQMDRI